MYIIIIIIHICGFSYLFIYNCYIIFFIIFVKSSKVCADGQYKQFTNVKASRYKQLCPNSPLLTIVIKPCIPMNINFLQNYREIIYVIIIIINVSGHYVNTHLYPIDILYSLLYIREIIDGVCI